MYTNTSPITTISRRSSAVTNANLAPDAAAVLLQAARRLWQATDQDAVVAATSELLGQLVPGTVIERYRIDEGRALTHGATVCSVQIPLSGQEALWVTTPHDNHGPLIQSAAELVEARVDVLGRRLELAESVEQLGRSERLQRALYAIADLASSSGTDLAPMCKALHAIVGTLMYAENLFIALYDAEQDGVWFPYFADGADPAPPLNPAAIITSPDERHPVWAMDGIKYGPTWYLIREGKPLMGSLEYIGSQMDGPFHAAGTDCTDFLGAPLRDGDEVVGCVAVQSYDELRQFGEHDRELLIYVAQHIQTTLERRRAHIELEHRVEARTAALQNANRVLQREVEERERSERLQAALFRIAELAGDSDSLEDFYAAVHGIVGDLLYARNFYIALVSDDGAQLTFPYLADERDKNGGQPRAVGDGLTEHVLRHETAVLADAEYMEQLCAQGVMRHYGPHAAYWLGVPLVCDDTTVGVLAVQSYTPEHSYTLRDQELLTFVSFHIGNALERKRAAESLREANEQLEDRVRQRTDALAQANGALRTEISERQRAEEQLKHQALHDSLTGLPNRVLFLQRLDDALQHYREDTGRGLAVLFMDLDRFKVINDSEGHLVGDDLLIQVGRRIRACLKTDDMVARLGGDEFSVLLYDVDDNEAARGIAERIIASLVEPFWLEGKELFTSTSIGIALGTPHYQSSDELLRDADSAMYRAKAAGRHRSEVFDDEMRQNAVSLLAVQNDLRQGIGRHEFVPYYQPIIDLWNGNVAGYEALMRWQHPQRGILTPGEFLTVANDMGAAKAMDWQIFTQVCRDANLLAADNGAFVSINLPAYHFNTPGLDQNLLQLLTEHDVPASRLCVEVTEHALLENTAMVKRTLHELRHAGVKISLDDFGTGYSSLSYLHQYPLQTLKIDQSFVANLVEGTQNNRDAVIRAIVAMAGNLSIGVIAEGVETTTQRDLLRHLGCRYVQGFLYSKARPLNEWVRDDASRFAS